MSYMANKPLSLSLCIIDIPKRSLNWSAAKHIETAIIERMEKAPTFRTFTVGS